MKTDELLQERGTTHGSFRMNSYFGQQLRDIFHMADGWRAMPLEHREALDMMACKLSRILSGQSKYADHWRDLQGYAKLAEDVCDK